MIRLKLLFRMQIDPLKLQLDSYVMRVLDDIGRTHLCKMHNRFSLGFLNRRRLYEEKHVKKTLVSVYGFLLQSQRKGIER